MATPVSAAPPLDPRVIHPYRFVAVSTTGVRTPVESSASQHHTVPEAQAKAAAIQAQLGTTVAAIVEIWPAAPPCYNPGTVC